MEVAADCAVFLTGRKNLKLESTLHDAVFSEAYLLSSLEPEFVVLYEFIPVAQCHIAT